MREDQMHDAPAPDPELARALRSLGEEPPLERVDWEALRAPIHARAELPLARLRRAGEGAPATPRKASPARVWLRPLVPLAAAAGIGAVALLGWPGAEEPAPPAATAMEERIDPEEVFRADLSEQEFRLLVSESGEAEELLLIAVGEGGGDAPRRPPPADAGAGRPRGRPARPHPRGHRPRPAPAAARPRPRSR